MENRISAKQEELGAAADEETKSALEEEIGELQEQISQLQARVAAAEASERTQVAGRSGGAGTTQPDQSTTGEKLSGESERIGTRDFDDATPFGDRSAIL